MPRAYERFLSNGPQQGETVPVPRGYDKYLMNTPQMPNLAFDVPRGEDIDVSTMAGKAGKDIAAARQRQPGMAERLLMFGLKSAPYMAAAEFGGLAGAGLVRGAPVLGRLLGSGAAQAGVAMFEGATPMEAAKSAGTGMLVEGGMARLGAKSALKRGVPPGVVGGTMERTTPGMASEMFGRVTPEQEAAQAIKTSEATKQAMATISPGRQAAETMMAFRDKLRSSLGMQPGVDTSDVVDAMRGQIHPEATLPERQALNEWLEERAASLPPRMTHEGLDSFIREWRETIKSTYGRGKSEISVPQQVKRTTVDSAKALRDRLMPEAAPHFAEAEQYLDATKTLQKMLVDAKGKVRPGAVGLWRQAMENDIILQRLRKFDEVTGGKYNVTESGLQLARKKAWTSQNAVEAISYLRLSASPHPVVNMKAPGIFGKATLLGSRPTGAITTETMQQMYQQSQPQTPLQVEDFQASTFPGMTNP